METKKTSLHLTYKVQEKPDGGFIARSEDPSVEPIEAATKEELVEKIRTNTAQLIGREIPLSPDALSGGNPAVQQKLNVHFNTSSTTKPANQSYMVNDDAQPLAQSVETSNIWKLLFFVLLGLVLAWWLRHR